MTITVCAYVRRRIGIGASISWWQDPEKTGMRCGYECQQKLPGHESSLPEACFPQQGVLARPCEEDPADHKALKEMRLYLGVQSLEGMTPIYVYALLISLGYPVL